MSNEQMALLYMLNIARNVSGGLLYGKQLNVYSNIYKDYNEFEKDINFLEGLGYISIFGKKESNRGRLEYTYLNIAITSEGMTYALNNNQALTTAYQPFDY